MVIIMYITTFIIGILLGNVSIAIINKISTKNKKEIKPNLMYNFLMGIISIGIFYSVNFTIASISILTIIEYIYLMIFITTLIIIAGIDKKDRKIYKPIIFLGSVIGGVYIVYLYIIKNVELFSIYKYVIYFIIICTLSIITSKYKNFRYKYLLEIMMICIYINIFVVSEVFLITAIFTMISLTVASLIKKHKQKIDNSDILAEKYVNLDIPIGMYLCISNIVAMLISGIEFIRI